MVCPNELVTLDCTASSYEWSGSAFNCSSPVPDRIRISFLIPIDDIVLTCGEYNATGIKVTGSLVTSQLMFIATPGLDGSTITCVNTSNVVVLNETIRIDGE